MRYLLHILIILIFILNLENVSAQTNGKNLKVLQAKVVDGDTMIYCSYPEVRIFEKKRFKSKVAKMKYTKLVRDVKKAYPYAKIAGVKLEIYNNMLKDVKNDQKKHRIMKKIEEELRAEFEGELRKLTIKQGIILVKLIDRETGNTSYELVKELRGTVTAFFWQSIARLFGSNLKLEYEPEGDDKDIEDIVIAIESGMI